VLGTGAQRGGLCAHTLPTAEKYFGYYKQREKRRVPPRHLAESWEGRRGAQRARAGTGRAAAPGWARSSTGSVELAQKHRE